MSIRTDVEKLQETWSQLNLFWRVILGVMISIQAMSIASLGESIYEFKGFILDGIELYRSITKPLVDLNIPLVTRSLIDTFTWVSLFAVSMAKAERFIRNPKSINVNRQLTLKIIIIAVPLVIANYFDSSLPEVLPWWVFSVLFAIVVLSSWGSNSLIPIFFFALPILILAIFSSINYGLFAA